MTTRYPLPSGREEPDEYMTGLEVRGKLKIGKTTFWKIQKPGSTRYDPDFPRAVPQGRNRRYPTSEVIDYIEVQKDRRPPRRPVTWRDSLDPIFREVAKRQRRQRRPRNEQ